MISEVSITCGNTTIQKYSGSYLLASVQRDFNTSKKELFERAIMEENNKKFFDYFLLTLSFDFITKL